MYPLVARARETLSRFGRTVLAVLALVLLVPSCAVDPYTGRRMFHAYPDSTMNQLGDEAYQQILAESDISANRDQAQLVATVGRRIAAVVDRYLVEELDKPPFDWQFTLIESEQVNAFCLPGGKVAFYTGILPVCQDELGIAVVMGHEAAHAAAGHGNSRMTVGTLSNLSLQTIQAALSTDSATASPAELQTKQLVLGALGVGANLGVLAYGRGDESHADELGLYFMAEAGYDPRAAVGFWERMRSMSGGQAPPEFLSSHPSHDTRISDLKKWMPDAIERYEQATTGGATTGGATAGGATAGGATTGGATTGREVRGDEVISSDDGAGGGR